jgi:metal-responsive CopG/Arc/MetJ family transcriptional regulator
MSYDDNTAVSLNIPTALVEKLDTIAKLKYLNREDVIIDACAYYCQFYDMHSERFPETMRSIFFNLARHDDEFRKLLRKVVQDNPVDGSDNQ